MYNQDVLISIIIELKKNYNSLNEFAKAAGVNAGYLSKIINKRTLNAPTPNILEKLSNTSILHKDEYYSKMMNACGYINNTLSNENMKIAKEKSNLMSLDEKKEKLLNYMNKNNIENLFAIPLYNIVKSSLNDSQKYIEGYIPVNPHMYNMKNPDEYFYLKISDDSMDKKYQEGDYILMQKSSNIKNDTIALLVIDNTTIVRKITIQDNLLLLEPLSNNTKYKTKVCEKSKVTILGIVIGFIGYENN